MSRGSRATFVNEINHGSIGGIVLHHGYEPEQRETVYAWYAERVGAIKAMDSGRITATATAWEDKLTRDQQSRSQAVDLSGTLLYESANGEHVPDAEGLLRAYRGHEPLFVAKAEWADARGRRFGPGGPTNQGSGYTASELGGLHMAQHDHFGMMLVSSWSGKDAYLISRSSWLMVQGALPPVMVPTEHKPAYVNACLGQIISLQAQVQVYKEELAKHIAGMGQDIAKHLWIAADFLEPAAASLDGTRRGVRRLLRRLQALREGYEALPTEWDLGVAAAFRQLELDEVAEGVSNDIGRNW